MPFCQFQIGGRFYRDAENERSAYAQTDRPDGKASWLDLHRLRVKKSAPDKVVFPKRPQEITPGFLDDEPGQEAPWPSTKELDPGCGHEGCQGISHCIEEPP